VLKLPPNVEEYVASAAFKVSKDDTADAWFATMRKRRKLGMAMAAIMSMIMTAIKSSISENPWDSLPIRPPLRVHDFLTNLRKMDQTRLEAAGAERTSIDFHLHRPKKFATKIMVVELTDEAPPPKPRPARRRRVPLTIPPFTISIVGK
jgi:hypothetical protein